VDPAGRFPLGVEVGSGAAVTLGEADLSAHVFTAGASGSGKTTGLVRLAAAAVEWGRPVVFIDLKGDPTVVAQLEVIAAAAGVACRAWTLDGGASWDPLAHGDASQLKDKLVGLEEWGDPHYKLAASRFVQLVFAATHAAGTRPSLADVVALLDPKKVSAAARSWPAGAGDALLAYADSLTPDQRSGVAGLATRLGVLTESTAGPYLASGPDAIDLAELVTGPAGGIVIFSLDSGRWPEVARQVGTLVVQDLRAVCGAALQRPVRRGWTVIVDEFSALDATHLLGLFARGRAAGCSVVLSTQELADLDAAGAGFRDQVLGNAATKICFRQDIPASAELWAEMVGTEAAWVETIQTAHRSGGPLAPTVGQATGTGSLRSVERFLWHPNVIKRLPQGRCLVITKHPAFSARLCDVVIPTTSGKAAAA
jgi:type IV secretory pathway TraG/TraD family ATPase VirD4